jgi:hypothetical protein
VCQSNGGKASPCVPLGMGYVQLQDFYSRKKTARFCTTCHASAKSRGLTSINCPGSASSLWPLRSAWPGAGRSSCYAWHGGSVHARAYPGGLRADKELGNDGLHTDCGSAEPGTGSGRLAAHRQHPRQRRRRRLGPGTSRLYKDSSPGVVFSIDAMLGASSAGMHA